MATSCSRRVQPFACGALLAILMLASLPAAQGADWLRSGQLPSIPNAVGVAAPFAGVSGGALLVAGGANFPEKPPWEGGAKVWHDAIYLLPAPDATWREVGRLPRRLAYGVSITTPEGVVCIGGSDAERHYADVFRLRWDGKQTQIEPLPALPEPLANACGALVGQAIYLAGGTTAPDATQARKLFLKMDLSQQNPGWQTLEPCPGEGRMLAVAGAQEGAFFLFSGVSLSAAAAGAPQRHYLSDAWRFDPGPRGGWRRLADLPRPVAAAPSPALKVGPAHLMVLGGDDGTKVGYAPVAEHPGFPTEVLAYHTITDRWSVAGSVPTAQVTVPAVEWRGAVVVPSGEIRPGVRTAGVWSGTVAQSRAEFGWLNYATLIVYLLGVVALGSWFARRNKTTDDFFRGGQRAPWWAAGMSIFATMLSSITFMAIPAQSFSVGWNLYLANSYLILTPLVVLVYLPFYRRLNVTSAYEYLERRFNVVVRLIASVLFMLFQLGRVAIVLYLPALALATVSNFDIRLCIVLMGALVIVYSVLGGMEGVIWTDVAQSLVLLGGALWALATVLASIDGGAGEALAIAREQERFFSTVRWDLDFTAGVGWVILVGSIFTNLFPYTASQDIVQRYVTTASERGAARAIWTSAVISPIAQGIFFAVGTALFVFYRQHPERLDPTLPIDSVFPQFIVRELPAGVAGLIVAGIFAAAQSTLSSSLNAVASAYVTDVHRRFRPATRDAAALRLARWLTALVGIVGTGAALVFTALDIRSLWEAFLGIIGLLGGTISGLFMLGIFSRRASSGGALAGALVSVALVLGVKTLTPAHFFLYPIVGVVSCVAVGWLASWLLPDRPRDLRGLTIYTRQRAA